MLIWLAFGIDVLLVLILVYVGCFQDRSRGRPRCPKCWYNMTGAPSLVCPECGHDARHEKRLYRTRRRRGAVTCAAVLALGCVYLWQVRIRLVHLNEPAAIAIRPTIYLLAELPQASRVDLGYLQARFDRCGVWPWESQMLLVHLDQLLAARFSASAAVNLLATSARSSDAALNRIVGLCEHPDRGIHFKAQFAAAEQARRLSDSQLSYALDLMLEEHPWSEAEVVLVEMVRRHSLVFREQIARWVATPPNKMFASSTPSNQSKYVWNAELVTALRRFDGQPDPMRVFVAPPETTETAPWVDAEGHPVSARTIECTAVRLPTIHVSLGNVDVGGAAVGMNVTSPRSPGWGLDIRSEHGPVECRPLRSDETWSSGFVMFKPGEHREFELDMSRFVQTLAPGRYRVVVQYRDAFGTAFGPKKGISNRIVFSSEPFELIVRAR